VRKGATLDEISHDLVALVSSLHRERIKALLRLANRWEKIQGQWPVANALRLLSLFAGLSPPPAFVDTLIRSLKDPADPLKLKELSETQVKTLRNVWLARSRKELELTTLVRAKCDELLAGFRHGPVQQSGTADKPPVRMDETDGEHVAKKPRVQPASASVAQPASSLVDEMADIRKKLPADQGMRLRQWMRAATWAELVEQARALRPPEGAANGPNDEAARSMLVLADSLAKANKPAAAGQLAAVFLLTLVHPGKHAERLKELLPKEWPRELAAWREDCTDQWDTRGLVEGFAETADLVAARYR
jgi:hypothetical protein